LGVLLLIPLLLFVLAGGPFLLARFLGVWAGLGAAALAIPAWIFLGPRPLPGLFPGIVALSGLGLLLGTLVVWIVQVIRHVAG
jgi:hypothetical protein